MGDVLREYPRIQLEKKFLSDEEVLHLLNLAEGKWERSTVVDNNTGDSVVDEYRTGQYAMLRETDSITKAIDERIAAVTRTRVAQAEGLQAVKYREGETYKPHFDWFDPKIPGSIKQMKFGGQRVATVIMYLKPAEEGGETEFPELAPPIVVKPEVGDAIIFWNLDPHGKPERLSKHAGNPVKKGEKIIVTRWIRERAADGSEEMEALDAKRAERVKVEAAKKAAQDAQKELAAAMAEEVKAREAQCFKEINELLKKHRCNLRALPMVDIGPNGMLQIGASVDLVGVPDQQEPRQ